MAKPDAAARAVDKAALKAEKHVANSVSSLENAVKSAKGQPPLTAASTVVPAVTQVKNSASSVQSAVSGKCS